MEASAGRRPIAGPAPESPSDPGEEWVLARPTGNGALELAMRALDAVADAVVVHDASEQIIYANATAAAFFGRLSPDALIGTSVARVLAEVEPMDAGGRPLTARDLPAAVALAGAAPPELVLRCRMPSTGEERWVSVTAGALQDPNGRVALAVSRFRDITSERRAEESLRFLAEASALLNDSLDYEWALRRLARLVVPRLADWCIVDVVAGLHAPRRLAVEHADPGRAAWAREASLPFTLDLAGPGFTSRFLRSGESALFPRVDARMLEQVATSAEHLQLLLEAGVASVIIVPLLARGRTLGVITLIRSTGGRPYDAEDLALAEDLARRAALAVAHALAHDAEARARDLTAALAQPMSRVDVAAVVLERVVPALGARRAALTCISEDGTALELLGTTGTPDPTLHALRRLPLDADGPMVEAVREERPVVITSREEIVSRYPRLADEQAFAGDRALVAIPLLLNGRVMGAIRLGFAEPRAFGTDDLDLLLSLGRQVALALDRVRLYDAERRARAAAEQAERRQAVLAEASRLLAASLDDEAVLQQVAELATPVLGDWCAVDLQDEAGELRRVAVAVADPAWQSLADAARRLPPANAADTEGIAQVLRTGEPTIYANLSAEMVAAMPHGPQRDLVQRAGITGAITVPLVARGRTLGALTLALVAASRRFTDDDVATGRNLADIAALAIDNGRLVRRAEQGAARTAARARALRAVAEARLDREAVLASITRSVSELTGDAVVVRLISGDGRWLETVAVEHPVPEERDFLYTLLAGTPQQVDEGLSVGIFATGEGMHVPAAREEDMLRQTRPEYRAYHDRYGGHGMFIAPLRVAGRAIGTISVVRAADQPPYTAEERAFVQDLADIAALAIENARLYTQAQDALRAREHFLSIAAHELRTPLTAVKGQAQLVERFLARGPHDPERLSTAISRLSRAVSRLDLLVRDLVDVSRLQAGRLALRREPVDLVSLAHEVMGRFADEEGPEARHPHRFVVEAPGPVTGLWDPVRLDQVLANLVGNAVKYSPDGGRIRVTVRPQADDAELVIWDEGVGIDPADQGRLFQPFERGSGAEAFEGTGLGLFIARQIVEQHGGTLTFVSEPGRGSAFTVRLPHRPPDEAASAAE
ncbi:MAG TPA: GAF domain-containing protein [Thermomicrobiaceae bacterium]|nr:GAF domain-containing protein [Thermomicrobiaceae bacterium]